MKKLNVGLGDQQKGITLIALIITIIVMLILVGVTINVALSGGLIEKATTASNQTQIEVLKEKAELAKANAYAESIKNETTLNANSVAVAIAEELEGTATENYVTVETTKGTYYIVVSNDLKLSVTETQPQSQPVEVDDLIPTDAEKALADYNSGAGNTNMYRLADSANDYIIYYEMNNNNVVVNMVTLMISGNMYLWVCDEDSIPTVQSMQGMSQEMEANKWYKQGEAYMETCPITENTFNSNEIKSDSYLQRVINSFN